MKWNIVIGSMVLGLALSTQSFGFELLDRMLGMNYNGSGCDVSCCQTNGCADPCGAQACCDPCNTCCSAVSGTPILDAIRCRMCQLKNVRLLPRRSCCDPCCDPCAGAGCEPSCGCEPGCGPVVDPGCGCEPSCCAPCCQPRCRTPLLDLFRCKRSCCCDPCAGAGCEPSCGCEPGCGAVVDPGCGCEPSCCAASCCQKRCRTSLLDRIFGRRQRCRTSCCDPCCDPCCEPTCGCEPSCGMESMEAPAEPSMAEPKEATPPAPVVDPSAFLRNNKRRVIQTSLTR